MATWHVKVNSAISASKYTSAKHALILKPVSLQFERLGFTVQPLPESVQPAISVSHASEGAVTLYLLRYSSDNIVIQHMI